MAELLLGKPVADRIFEQLLQSDKPMRLAVLGFSDPQWQQYVSALERSAAKCNITVENVNAEGLTPAAFCQLVAETCARKDVHGVVLQQPLPVEFRCAAEHIAPEKDVDCISDASVAKLYRGAHGFCPATPLAVLKLLDYYGVELCGQNVVIVGRGNAVGKPLALMCLAKNATVTVCHTKTRNLAAVCRGADIIISACGVAGLITREFVTEHSIVVDVGLSFVDGQTRGDVSEEVQTVAKAVSPVPGGVGPITRVALFTNLYEAAKALKN